MGLGEGDREGGKEPVRETKERREAMGRLKG